MRVISLAGGRCGRGMVEKYECGTCGGEVEMVGVSIWNFYSSRNVEPLGCMTCGQPYCGGCLDGNGECENCRTPEAE